LFRGNEKAVEFFTLLRDELAEKVARVRVTWQKRNIVFSGMVSLSGIISGL